MVKRLTLIDMLTLSCKCPTWADDLAILRIFSKLANFNKGNFDELEEKKRKENKKRLHLKKKNKVSPNRHDWQGHS